MGGDAAPKHGAVPEEDMMKNRIELSFRDACAHLLIPLNDCRKETWSSPNSCHHERHIYEKCQYIDWKKRQELMKEKKRLQAFEAAQAAEE